ncbi:MAG: beta-N-acetylhexosaminidase, partial [Candidatus Omnitrophica bacterium]|nr:beta-N-acetylhexosaminidase [Candidatus Omnitrophota bacterium]
MQRTTILCIGLMALVDFSQAVEVEQLRLVPFPKEIRSQPGQFALGPSLVWQVPGAQREVFGRLLNDELKRADLGAAEVRALDSPGPAFRLSTRTGSLNLPAPPNQGAPEGYALEVRPNEVVCAAREPAGLLYGLQTLCQLIRANRQGDALPCLGIRDWPSLRWRSLQDDMTRGPSSTLDTLKFEASLGAYLKMNLMTYYMEYQFAFNKHPQIGPTNGSLSAEELSALVAYAKP